MNYALIDACQAWLDGEQVGDGSIDGFAYVVALAIDAGVSARSIADEFEAIPSTPSRWAKGMVRPAPGLQRQVVRWLLRRGWMDEL